jgi:hypothetical protein
MVYALDGACRAPSVSRTILCNPDADSLEVELWSTVDGSHTGKQSSRQSTKCCSKRC